MALKSIDRTQRGSGGIGGTPARHLPLTGEKGVDTRQIPFLLEQLDKEIKELHEAVISLESRTKPVRNGMEYGPEKQEVKQTPVCEMAANLENKLASLTEIRNRLSAVVDGLQL